MADLRENQCNLCGKLFLTLLPPPDLTSGVKMATEEVICPSCIEEHNKADEMKAMSRASAKAAAKRLNEDFDESFDYEADGVE